MYEKNDSIARGRFRTKSEILIELLRAGSRVVHDSSSLDVVGDIGDYGRTALRKLIFPHSTARAWRALRLNDTPKSAFPDKS